MAPFVKDPENATAPGVPAPAAPKLPADARPQPVALEVPVTVNGARTVEGSDKREPFSEKSQTVLVFGHGAVIRVSAVLAAGQLVFLTNEKSKKEVVCQVVKSKTDGNAVGYVELRFTEPAPGFWGMRFPSDTVMPQVAARPAGPAVVPAPPKAAVAPPAPPIAPKPVAPPPPIALKPVIDSPPAPFVISPEPPKPPAPFFPKSTSVVESPVAPLTPHPVFAEALPSTPAVSAAPEVPSPHAAPPVRTAAESKPAIPSYVAPAQSAASPSTEDLKQQAARLQEQLSSLLFTEAPKPAATDRTPAPPAAGSVNTPDVAQKVLDLANPAPEAAPRIPVKSVPPLSKPGLSSLDADEIKVPAWLAPLARETDSSASEAASVEPTQSDNVTELLALESAEHSAVPEFQEPPHRPETAVFGGQLLGESSQPENASSGSKKGLFLGVAASLLLIAGGVWYSHQPGNAISGSLSGGSKASQPAVSSPEAAAPVITKSTPPPVVAKPAPPVVASSTSSFALAGSNPPAASAPVNSAPAAPAPRNTNPVSSPSPRNIPPAVEQSTKPSLGEVHLAAPKVNRAASSSSGDAEPAIDINSATNTSTALSTLDSAHKAGPAVPVPVGGDVKPAKLLKSVPPIYPEMAKNQHISGSVQIDALIDTDGNVSSMKVLSGPTLLHQSALNAVKQWKYQPAALNGNPTSIHLTVTVQFRAQ